MAVKNPRRREFASSSDTSAPDRRWRSRPAPRGRSNISIGGHNPESRVGATQQLGYSSVTTANPAAKTTPIKMGCQVFGFTTSQPNPTQAAP